MDLQIVSFCQLHRMDKTYAAYEQDNLHQSPRAPKSA